MTERYASWMAALASRDSALWSIFLLAAILVAGWRIAGMVIDPVARQRLQTLFLAGGLVLFYGSLMAAFIAR